MLILVGKDIDTIEIKFIYIKILTNTAPKYSD